MTVRKWTRGALAGTLMLSTFMAGCAGSNDAGKPADSGSAAPGSSAPAAIEISVTGMPKYAPNEIPNEYVKQVEERFGMDWDFEAIPLSAGLEKYNVMFASGEYPEFIPNMNSPSSVKKWASAGYLLPIGDYIDKLPNYRKLFTDEDWAMMLDFAGTDGKLYMLPSLATNDPMTWIFRKDAFDRAGIAEFPKTLDELREALRKLKEAYPESVGIGVRGGTGTSGIQNLMNGFRQSFRNPNNAQTRGFWNDPDAGGAVVWNMATDKHRSMLAYLAGLYKEGLIEKEFATLTQDQWVTKRLTGKVLLDFQWASHTVDPAYALTDIPGGRWEYTRALPTAGDLPALEFKPANFALFGPIFSSKLADQPEKLDKLFEYIEWSATPEGQLFHHMGIENVTYERKDGNIVYKEGLNRQKVAEEYGFDWFIKQSEEVLKSDATFAKKQEAMNELAGIYNVDPKSAPLSEEEQQVVNTTMSALEDIAYQFATKAVMGIVDVAKDAEWNRYLSDLEKSGLREATEIFQKYLQE
ncbi:extracellular solute-binding protein [Cohnella massiliensis]|uniref:extracellular solute-binding protein n=1 Tax=Cohnella massiliensis TaxID=1816691 RepID=UPI0015939DEC|nr:extracellular solute-binding protein [Cohnella massiliensis]